MSNLSLVTELERIFTGPGLVSLVIAGKLLLATGLGFLVGLERELATAESGVQKLTGLRTLSFVGLLGALSVLLDPRGMLTMLVLVVLTVFLAVAYVIHTRQGMSGLTTPTVTIVTFLLGAMVMTGSLPITMQGTTYSVDLVTMAVFTTILVMILLSTKRVTERIVAAITPEEFFASLKFAVIAFIILPFLPQGSLADFMGPEHPLLDAIFSAINPAKLWFLVVLISGIGLVGYVLGKIFGEGKGVGISGFLGGLVSSTAVMSATAAQSKSAVALPALLFATTVASITSFIRVALEVAAVDRHLIPYVIVPLGAMTIAAGIALWLLPRQVSRTPKGTAHVEHKSPFRMGPALKLTGFILGIKVLMQLALHFEIPGGLYVVSAITGLADVDAITLSVSDLAAKGQVARTVASSVVTIAVLANMGSKLAIAALFGTREFGKRVAIVFGSSIGAGLLAIAGTALVA